MAFERKPQVTSRLSKNNNFNRKEEGAFTHGANRRGYLHLNFMPVGYTSKIGVKSSESTRLKNELNALKYSETGNNPLWQIINWMAYELPNKLEFMKKPQYPIVITMHSRGYLPNYKKVSDVIAELSQDERKEYFGNTDKNLVDIARSRFYGRETISENENIYKHKILAGKSWRKYSPHFNLPNQQYSRAVDIRTTGGPKDEWRYTIAEANQIVSATRRYASKRGYNIQIIHHAVKGNTNHIHLGLNTTKEQLEETHKVINEACGYEKIIQTDSTSPVTPRSMNDISEPWVYDEPSYLNYIAETDLREVDLTEEESKKTPIKSIDPRKQLSSELIDGLMDVLKIGDLEFLVCPVTQISFSQSSQFIRFSSLRTVGDPKIVTTTSPSNVSATIIFPSRETINEDLRKLVAQFQMTPITVVQSRFIAKSIKSFQADHKGKSIENEYKDAKDESMWMIMTDLQVRSIPGFTDSYEAVVSLSYFEDRVFGHPMKFLQNLEDLNIKYDRKLKVNGKTIVLPADIERINRTKNYEPSDETLHVTSSPFHSDLYKEYYKSGMGDLYTDHDGSLTIEFNDMNFDRSDYREVEKILRRKYHQMLVATTNFADNAGDDVLQYLSGRTGTLITKDIIREVGGKISIDPVRLMDSIFNDTDFYARFQALRNIHIPTKARLVEALRDNTTAARTIAVEIGLDQRDGDAIREWLEKVTNLAGTLSIPDNITSIGRGLHDLSDISGGANIANGRGLIAEIELLIGSTLFDVNPDDDTGTVVTDEHIERVKKIREAFLQIISSYINLSGQSDRDKEDVERILNNVVTRNNRRLELADGENSIITGLSFVQNNKVVPIPIMGWNQPTYQHLGRSDWSINLALTVKGDDKIHEIMYAMNKTSHISKLVQLTTPLKFGSLDTTMILDPPVGIFKVLGINKIHLSTAQIKPLNNQINCYAITLGFEQGDLNVRELEDVKMARFKRTANNTKNVVISKIAPILKSIIIEPSHPNYGEMLDFNRIKKVMEDERLDFVLSFLGIKDFDYMDRYNILKLSMVSGWGERTINLEDYKKRMYLTGGITPERDEYFKQIRRYTVENFKWAFLKIHGKSPTIGQWRPIDEAVKEITYLMRGEVSGNLLHPSKVRASHSGLEAALNEYHTSVINVVNGYINLQEYFVRNRHNYDFVQYLIGGSGGILSAGAIYGGIVISAPVLITGLIVAGVVALTATAIGGIEWYQTTKELLNRTVLNFAAKMTENKLVDLAWEFIIDEDSLNIFNKNMIIEEGVTLQSVVDDLRRLIETTIGGCYSDFQLNANTIQNKSGIPFHVLDPAFYLFAEDFTTIQFVRENIQDIQDKMGLIESYTVLKALQLGRRINEVEGDINGEVGKIETQEDNPKRWVNKSDLDWIKKINNRIEKIYANAIDGNTEDVKKLQNIHKRTDEVSKLFKDDFMKEVAAEEAFLRISNLAECLKWDLLQSDLESTINKVFSETREEVGTSIKDYNEFIDKWFPKIMKAGGIESPGSDSVDNEFKDEHEVSIRAYYKSRGLGDLVNQAERLAKIHRSYNVMQQGASAKVMAEYAGLLADPRMYTKQLSQLKTLVDGLYNYQIQDQTSDTVRIFPTYKIYFIEEDAPQWGIFHDFYDYSAVNEITIVRDRESASDACVIKLSNITGKLTDSFAANLPEIGTTNVHYGSMMLKAGTSILVKMGYSNNQTELPTVFYGIISEVNAGPVVEIICQGYGAELHEVMATEEGKHFGALGSIKGHGNIASWMLEQSTGLNHFGKLGYSNIGKDDLYRKNLKTLNRSKMTSWLTGITGITMNDPRDDNIYLPYHVWNIKNEDIGFISTFIKSRFSLKNPTFDWYIRDTSIWDTLKELSFFHPDTVVSVLPYNDNIFPFVPTNRKTIYIGPKKGYYKYTDYFSIGGRASNLEEIQSIISEFKTLIAPLIENYPSYGGWESEIKNIVNPPTTYAILKGKSGEPNRLDDNFLNFYNFITRDTSITNIIGSILGIDVNSLTNNDKPYKEYYTLVGKLIDSYVNQFSDQDIAEYAANIFSSETGLTSIRLNITGNSPQYRKFQQHYIATSHTNIISNNVSATSNGWANQIRLLTFKEPSEFSKKSEIPIEKRDNLISEVFNLDDDILDDHIRSKECFINNIDPNLWDDAAFAKFAINGRGPWYSMDKNGITRLNNGEVEYVKETSEQDTVARRKAKTQNDLWRYLPSRWRVGISILAEESKKMYDGEIIITGNGSIKPHDVLHIMDYTNDMHGAVEVRRVVHSFNTDSGFMTRITPDLIVRQKDKFNVEEVFYMSKLMQESSDRMLFGLFGRGVTLAGATGLSSMIGKGVGAIAAKYGAAAVTSFLSTASLVVGAGIGVYLGYKTLKYNAQRAISIMGQTIGRDSLDIQPLFYRGLPYTAGIEGYRKDGPIKHMYSTIFRKDSKDGLQATLIEKLGYASNAYEMEFYSKILGDNKNWAAFKTFFGFGDRYNLVSFSQPSVLAGGARSFANNF